MVLLTGVLFLVIGLSLILRYFRNRENCVPIRGELHSYIKEVDLSSNNPRDSYLYQPVIRIRGFDGNDYIFLHPIRTDNITKKIGQHVDLLVRRNDPLKVYPKSPLELFLALIVGVAGIGTIALTYQSKAELIWAALISFGFLAFESQFKKRTKKRFRKALPDLPMPKVGFELYEPEVYLEKDAPHARWAEYLETEAAKKNSKIS